MLKEELSLYELDCIRFYMGDPAIVNRGDFRGGPKAYNTINALLHDGIQNELDKIRDGKPIEIFDANHVESYMSLISSIYLAMEKYCCYNQNTHLTTYRVDRFSEIAGLKEKRILEGFYSTCKRGYLSEYANTKSDIVLLEILRQEDVPYLDFECLFSDYYAKPQEAEILLPFEARVSQIEEVPLTEAETESYRDMNGNPPIGKYKVLIENNPTFIIEETAMKDCEILSDETVLRVRKFLKKLTEHDKIKIEEIDFYTNWKRNVKLHISKMIEEKNDAF